MRLFVTTLTFLLLVGCAGRVPPISRSEERSSNSRHVTGVLAFNLEYSYFTEKGSTFDNTFESKIDDARWLKTHPDILLADHLKGIEYRCISGSGYEDRMKLGPTGRSTFVFTVIRSISRANSERDCLPKTSGG